MLLAMVWWGGLGLIFGSFTNVLIARYDSGKSIGGRSECPQCHRTLEWFELVPIMSWLLLRGRCRTCRVLISLQYPLIEALVAVGFLAIGLAPVSLIARVLGCGIIILLAAISAYDIRHMLMPDVWVYGFGILAFFSGAIQMNTHDPITWTLFFIAGPVVALPLFLLWFFSNGRWMGFGDVKFALGIGWLLSISSGYSALCLSFVIGAIVGVFVLIPLDYLGARRTGGITGFHGGVKRLTIHSEVPFGPFLICGTCIVWIAILYHFDIAGFLGGFLSLSSWS